MRKVNGLLDKDEGRFFRKLVKALTYLQENPRHNSLATHEIEDLTRKCGVKVFQSYLENNTPSAGRLFWAYGPDKGARQKGIRFHKLDSSSTLLQAAKRRTT